MTMSLSWDVVKAFVTGIWVVNALTKEKSAKKRKISQTKIVNLSLEGILSLFLGEKKRVEVGEMKKFLYALDWDGNDQGGRNDMMKVFRGEIEYFVVS